ncbi:MAG: YkgJ family cysteine cluster protein [Deltaproteobacteria bacterium]|nr:YkgJ family cysteine cluster protein [Deltaproteobacteria bacterium]MBW1953201.1 YkgJ family cysteine cluster protein [Deltaproteobacteria bacterium]MBW1985660.1 YkgJ family cysteine cluster protein [Deltaproteobacteria bacterium]MBW2134399.1 YkgJ family cysteine cluster protein [Deltaproteobacteria bacterium]
MYSMRDVKPVKLSLKSKFRFNCHPGISCYTQCCGRINIILTPYDIIRLKHRLGLSSGEFLSRYTREEIEERSGLPIVFLKMQNDQDNLCPFVTPEGCTIYTDRPAACRYYPIGQGTLQKEDGIEEFYFLIAEKHCLGYKEDHLWTIESWRLDQEVAQYDELNAEWKAMMLRRDSQTRKPIDPKQQTLFYLASYDLDNFRRYILESRFLEVFAVAPETLTAIQNDDVALLKFGCQYLKYILMIEESMKLKAGTAASLATSK